MEIVCIADGNQRGIMSDDIIPCQQTDMPFRGDAQDFLRKLSALQTEISAV
jgi:hypothetical protein